MLSSNQVLAVLDTTTTSNTDVVAAGMTLTPLAGTYLVWFNGSAELNQSAGTDQTFISVYSAGSQATSSEERCLNGTNSSFPFSCMAKVTVDGTQTIEGRWRVDGGTGTMHQRSLIILRLG